MNSYTKVIDAVRDGKQISETEKDYALVLAHYLLMRLYFNGKRVMAHDTSRERDTFERILEDIEDFLSRDLEPLIKGSSMEPGISSAERTARSSQPIADVATRLQNILGAVSKP